MSLGVGVRRLGSYGFVGAVLLLLTQNTALASIRVSIPDTSLGDWESSNPGAVEVIHYKFNTAGDTLEFDTTARTVAYGGQAFNPDDVGDALFMDVTMSPVYNFPSTGGLFLFENNETFGVDYLAIRYSSTGNALTNQIFFEANGGVSTYDGINPRALPGGASNESTLLASGFTFEDTLSFEVVVTYTAASEWTLTGQILSGQTVVWDSATAPIASLSSSVLVNDGSVYFGAEDFTSAASSAFTELTGEFGAVPELSHLAFSSSLFALGIVWSRRQKGVKRKI